MAEGDPQPAPQDAPSRRAPARGAGRYALAAVDQGLWSLLNLGLSLSLARFLAVDEYGAFMFWTNTAYVMSSLQSALTLTHVIVLAPGEGRDPHRLQTEGLMHLVQMIFLVLAGLVILGISLVIPEPFGSPMAALYMVGFLAQQYLRAIAFSRGRAGIATFQSGLVLVLALALVGGVFLWIPHVTADWILACLGIAYGSVAVLGSVRLCGDQWPEIRRARLPDYLGHAATSGWVFLGVTSTEILARFYAFIVADWYGARALAVLSAAQVLMRPIAVLAMSWSMVARTDLNRQRDAGHWNRFGLSIAAAMVGGVVVSAVWTAGVATAWPQISRIVFGGRYADIEWMVVLWGVSSAVYFCQTPLNVGMQVMRAFKPLAVANTIASAVAAGGILLMMKFYGPGGAVIGTAAGQAMEVVVMAVLLVGMVRAAKGKTSTKT